MWNENRIILDKLYITQHWSLSIWCNVEKRTAHFYIALLWRFQKSSHAPVIKKEGIRFWITFFCHCNNFCAVSDVLKSCCFLGAIQFFHLLHTIYWPVIDGWIIMKLSSNFRKFSFGILIVAQYRSFHKKWKTFWTNQDSQVHLAGPLAISSSTECTGGYRFCPWWYEIRSLSTLLPWYGNFSSRNEFENFNLLSYLSRWFLLLLYNPH